MPRPSFIDDELEIFEMVRVNHAGEFGAKRIYQGQLDFIKDTESHRLITNMLEQEQKHLDYFDTELVKRKIRPTILMPIWHLGGYLLGALSAMAGTRFAMIITQSVEDVIEKHYEQQLIRLVQNETEQDLFIKIKQFQADEIEHKETAANYQKTGYIDLVIEKSVKNICKIAIYLSKKL